VAPVVGEVLVLADEVFPRKVRIPVVAAREDPAAVLLDMDVRCDKALRASGVAAHCRFPFCLLKVLKKQSSIITQKKLFSSASF